MANFDFTVTKEMIIELLYKVFILSIQKEYRVPLANYILKMDENINGSE